MAATPPTRPRWPQRAALGLLRRVGDRVARWLEPPMSSAPMRAAAPVVVVRPTVVTPAVARADTPADEPRDRDATWHAHALGHGGKWLARIDVDAPFDGAESTRRLRVAIRRVRAIGRVLAVGEQGGTVTDRGLRRLARRLGVLRDLDLAIEHYAAAHASAEDAIDRAALEELAGWLADRRRDALRRADNARTHATIADELAHADSMLHALADDEPRARELALHGCATQLAAIAACIDVPVDDVDLERLHDLRIAARRLRYTAELFEPLLDATGRERLARARDVQRAIGAHRDAAAWHELLRARIARADARGRITLSRGLARAYAHATATRERSFVDVGPALSRLRAMLD